MIQKIKPIILGLAVVGIIGAIIYLEPSKSFNKITGNKSEITVQNKEEKFKKYSPAKEITTPDGFINTDLPDGKAGKISVGEFVGKKVVLIDFWTYSCINCQRTIPYLNGWHQKYKDKGLVIIGVHTPEFEFEKNYENVLSAVKKFGIEYPVVLDNDYSTWTAYKNRYWPRKYLIDIDGFIVYDHIGEGGYEETEKKIQELLEERKNVLRVEEEITKDILEPELTEETDFENPKSPEIYFGSERNFYLGNGKSNISGIQNLSEPTGIKTNILYLSGEWDIQKEFAENKSAGAKIIFRYQAKNVYFVANSENEVKIKIKKDGNLIKEEIVKEAKLYKLIEDSEYGEHTLEIIIDNPGLRAFTFTFG